MQDEKLEIVEWMQARGFVPVLTWGGYSPGFDRNKAYQFMRPEWDSPSVFQLKDVNPCFDIAGLSYREITD